MGTERQPAADTATSYAHAHAHAHFVACSLGIDVANTGGTDGTQQFDNIPTADELRRWFAEGSLDLTEVIVTSDDLPALHALRDALRRIARQKIDGSVWDADDLALVNQAAAVAPWVLDGRVRQSRQDAGLPRTGARFCRQRHLERGSQSARLAM